MSDTTHCLRVAFQVRLRFEREFDGTRCSLKPSRETRRAA